MNIKPLAFGMMVLAAPLASCGGGGGGGNTGGGGTGGGGGGSTTPTTVTISGKITYDSVPHNAATSGLDYNNTTQKPARGVVLEALNSSGSVLVTTITDDAGDYSVTVNSNTSVRIRAKAQILQTSGAMWDVKVTDNTNGHALYALDGSLTSSGAANSTRNLNAGSGWGGSSYTGTRAAAPFAIIDPIYTAVKKFEAVDSDINFPAVEFRWSTRNRPVSGDLTAGEISTSFYSNGNIYILGAANTDTDEYDSHIVVHEWGHYFEDRLSRSDSVGGQHGSGDILDPRVAFGEGFGNALSGMILDDPVYRDSGGNQQAGGFSIDVDNNNGANPGWYSEASVQSILFDLYDAGNDGVDTVAMGLGPIYETLVRSDYRTSPVFTTIFQFATLLKLQDPGNAAAVDALTAAQSMNGTGIEGMGETNDGGVPIALPLYKTMMVNNGPFQVCFVDDVGGANKLGAYQYVKFNVPTAASYTIAMTHASGPMNRDPDFIILNNGTLSVVGQSTDVDSETQTSTLSAGDYIISANDFSNSSSSGGDTCFDITITG